MSLWRFTRKWYIHDLPAMRAFQTYLDGLVREVGYVKYPLFAYRAGCGVRKFVRQSFIAPLIHSM